MPDHPSERNPFHSLTRLAIGGFLLANDELQRQMRVWEQETARLLDEAQRSRTSTPLTRHNERPLALPPPPAGTSPDDVRYALIGLLFETQARLAPRQRAQRQDTPIDVLAEQLTHAAHTSHALAPLVQQLETLANRGEAEVQRWIEIGRSEERYSRELVQTAARSTVQTSIHEVVQNPEVHELVQQQGAGLRDEIIEELRERAVTLDTLAERFTRRLFARPQRETLPEPPEEVRAHAARLRPSQS